MNRLKTNSGAPKKGFSRLLATFALCSAALASPAATASSLKGELTIGGTGAAIGLMKRLGEEFRKAHPEATVNVLPSLGSGGGIKALQAGLLSLSVSSRPLNAAELASGLKPVEIARTPLVFVAGPGVAAKDITLQQLGDIYAGRTTHWPNGALIRPVLRPVEDIDTVMVKGISPALEEALQLAHQRPGKNVAITDTDSANALERIPGALGTSTLTLLKAENRTLQPLSVNGIPPLSEGRINPEYPYQKSIYVVVPPGASAVAQAFLQFLDSAPGLKALAQNGNVPLRPAP